MLIQYQILNMCLFELQRSRLPTAAMLKLEAQLYGLKRLLLLDQVAAIVKDDARSELEFMDLYCGFRSIANDDFKIADIEGLMMQQKELNDVFSSLCASECCEPSLDLISQATSSICSTAQGLARYTEDGRAGSNGDGDA